MKLYFAKIGLFSTYYNPVFNFNPICYTYFIISVKNYIDSVLCKLKKFKDSFFYQYKVLILKFSNNVIKTLSKIKYTKFK